MGNVAQLVTIENFGSPFLFEQKICWNPYFYSVFLTNSLFKKTNVAQLVTIKNPQTWSR